MPLYFVISFEKACGSPSRVSWTHCKSSFACGMGNGRVEAAMEQLISTSGYFFIGRISTIALGILRPLSAYGANLCECLSYRAPRGRNPYNGRQPRRRWDGRGIIPDAVQGALWQKVEKRSGAFKSVSAGSGALKERNCARKAFKP